MVSIRHAGFTDRSLFIASVRFTVFDAQTTGVKYTVHLLEINISSLTFIYIVHHDDGLNNSQQ